MYNFVKAGLRVFNSCWLYFLLSGETEWSYILKQIGQCIFFWSKIGQYIQEYCSRQKTIRSSDLSSFWITDTEKQVTWKNETKLEPNFRGYHSHFTSNYRPTKQYECSVSVQWHSTFSRQSEKSMHAVLTLTCTLLPGNQVRQVTHVGRKDVQKACISWDGLTALFTVNRYYAQWAVSPLHWGLLVLLGRHQDHVVVGRI